MIEVKIFEKKDALTLNQLQIQLQVQAVEVHEALSQAGSAAFS